MQAGGEKWIQQQRQQQQKEMDLISNQLWRTGWRNDATVSTSVASVQTCPQRNRVTRKGVFWSKLKTGKNKKGEKDEKEKKSLQKCFKPELKEIKVKRKEKLNSKSSLNVETKPISLFVIFENYFFSRRKRKRERRMVGGGGGGVCEFCVRGGPSRIDNDSQKIKIPSQQQTWKEAAVSCSVQTTGSVFFEPWRQKKIGFHFYLIRKRFKVVLPSVVAGRRERHHHVRWQISEKPNSSHRNRNSQPLFTFEILVKDHFSLDRVFFSSCRCLVTQNEKEHTHELTDKQILLHPLLLFSGRQVSERVRVSTRTRTRTEREERGREKRRTGECEGVTQGAS